MRVNDPLPSPNPHDTSRSNHAVGRMEMRMSEFKGTPGPWKIGTEARGYEVCTIHGVEQQLTEDGLGQSWIYVFPPRIINGEWHWPDGAEQLENSRLIAAAPELLEALVDCVGRFTEAFPAAENYEPIKKARAAISKALGEEK